MKITFEKKEVRKYTEDFNKHMLEIKKVQMRDAESFYIAIEYNGEQIGEGHLNLITNTAHIDLVNDNLELEEYLINGIEDRKIPLY